MKRLFALLLPCALLLCSNTLFALNLSLKPWKSTLPVSQQTGNNSIDFGSVTPDTTFQPALGFIEVAVGNYENVLHWKLNIYTDNTVLAGKGKQKGGMVHATSLDYRIPLGWKVCDSTTSAVTGGNPNNSKDNGWLWMKDKNDEDLEETESDESWDGSFNAGYTSVCSGNAAESQKIFAGGKAMASPVYIYIEGDFRDVPAGAYSGTLWFDLHTVADTEAPVVQHFPLGRIMRGNNIVLNARVSDNYNIQDPMLPSSMIT